MHFMNNVIRSLWNDKFILSFAGINSIILAKMFKECINAFMNLLFILYEKMGNECLFLNFPKHLKNV